MLAATSVTFFLRLRWSVVQSKCYMWIESGPKNVPRPNQSDVGLERSRTWTCTDTNVDRYYWSNWHHWISIIRSGDFAPLILRQNVDTCIASHSRISLSCLRCVCKHTRLCTPLVRFVVFVDSVDIRTDVLFLYVLRRRIAQAIWKSCVIWWGLESGRHLLFFVVLF